MQASKPGSSTHRQYKQRARQVLAQKRALERRLAAAMDQAYNVALMREAQAAARSAPDHAALLQAHAAQLGGAADADADADALDDAQERLDDALAVAELLARPLGGGDVDDDELEAELAAFAAEPEHGGAAPALPAPHDATPPPYAPPAPRADAAGAAPDPRETL